MPDGLPVLSFFNLEVSKSNLCNSAPKWPPSAQNCVIYVTKISNQEAGLLIEKPARYVQIRDTEIRLL
jgi:hypothetical protein